MDVVAFVGFYLCPSFGQACEIHKEQGCLFPLLPESLPQNCVKFVKEAPKQLFQGLIGLSWRMGFARLLCEPQAGLLPSGVWQGEDQKPPVRNLVAQPSWSLAPVLCEGMGSP